MFVQPTDVWSKKIVKKMCKNGSPPNMILSHSSLVSCFACVMVDRGVNKTNVLGIE